MSRIMNDTVIRRVEVISCNGDNNSSGNTASVVIYPFIDGKEVTYPHVNCPFCIEDPGRRYCNNHDENKKNTYQCRFSR